jgi:ankyrin repeat protein
MSTPSTEFPELKLAFQKRNWLDIYTRIQLMTDAQVQDIVTVRHNSTLLHVACMLNAPAKLIKLLLVKGISPMKTNNKNCIALYLAIMVDADITTIQILVYHESNPLFKCGPYNRSSIHAAIHHPNSNKVLKLLLQGIASMDSLVDVQLYTPIHEAIRYRASLEVVNILISSKLFHLNAKNKYGETALHMAVVLRCSCDVIRSLVKGGADTKIRLETCIDRPTAAMIAKECEYYEIIPLLISM